MMTIDITHDGRLPERDVRVCTALRDTLGIGLAEAFHLAIRIRAAPANAPVRIELSERTIPAVEVRHPDVAALLTIQVVSSEGPHGT